MRTSTIWSSDGIFFSMNGNVSPKGIRNRITVPAQRSTWEAAAMVELAGRIGLHLPDLPLPVYENLFAEDRLDSHSAGEMPADQRHFHLILGHEWNWLTDILGDRIHALEPYHQNEQLENGILQVIPEEEGTILVVTGTSPQMTLHAARALVAESFDYKSLLQNGHVLLAAKQGSGPSEARPENRRQPSLYSLHNLFTTEGIYQRKEGEFLPTLDVSLSVNRAAQEETVAFIELGARLAQAAGAVCFPLTHTRGETAASERFVVEIDTAVGEKGNQQKLQLSNQKRSLKLISHSDYLVAFTREILDEGLEPLDSWKKDTWRQRFSQLKSSSSDVAIRAQLGMQAFTHHLADEIQTLHVPEHLFSPVELWQSYVGDREKDRSVSLQMEKEQPIWAAEWKDAGELEEIQAYLLEQIEKLQAGINPVGSLELEVTTTCSEPTFREWSQQLQSKIHEQWGLLLRFVYRDANKSGLNWAVQEVLPQIKELAGIDRVELRARAFQPGEKHLDLVHRFLQELYPFDSILANALALSLERISLKLMEDEAAPMFSVAAFDQSGREIEAWRWEGWVESLPYMPGQPKKGNVIIPFAGIRIYEGATGYEIASQSFPTNPYRFWKWYQASVLPQVLEQVGSNPGVPKFSRLECHVGMDAVEKKLPHLEENSSVLEALHEDIYFYTLHAMHDHGKRVGDPEWDAPGGILPYMHVEPGAKPWASVALYAFPSDHRVWYTNHEQQREVIHPLAPELFAEARITERTSVDGRLAFSFEGGGEPRLEKECGDWLAAAACSAQPILQNAPNLQEKKSIWEDVFVNEDVQGWLDERVGHIPGSVTPIDFSLNGSWIWLVELFAQGKAAKASSRQEKHGLYKPTFFINARHHANEVSSTNAALQMIEKLAADPALLESVNLVIVPLENVDGAALHAEMAKENPCWKLHAARYNACGLEFAKYRFQEGVSFGESRVYPKVWERWAPDIVLDDHGIPSHEWIQPFSGYNSPPRFPVSYWIPSARMYTIWRELTEATHEQRIAYESLRSYLTARLDEDQEIAADNKSWLQTYRRWGNDFDNVHFPIELSNGSIAYTRDSPINRSSHDLIERFPEWVTADLMTEVNDETVYGKELAACRHAHHVVHQSIADWMKDRPIEVRVCQEKWADGVTRIGLQRTRPL
ncbi:zinc carboxypeptidase [Brevibacillus nitrificans]|uniref:Zinc carboxypeptidase n=1 Tax=Brevibacillus nitrificans TaxID=651560 RepID=A0A3M8DL78_9BACL|nr:M14 family metallopeptidase [Brevibacillus nitrificans]RNB88796.1 zinc carboxypeptidase [Brevibacillus nitrificans]